MPTTDARPTLEFADEFLRALDAEPTTKAAYRFALLVFAECLAENTGRLVPLGRLEPDSLVQFREWLTHAAPQGAAAQKHKKSKYSERTIAQYLVGVLRFLEWLDANGHLPEGLSSTQMRLILKNARGRKRRYYKPQPIQEAVPLIVEYWDRQPVEAAETSRKASQRLAVLRNRAMVHTLFATGLRAHELAKLKRKDSADGTESKIIIVGKGGKPRTVALDAEAQGAIQAYLKVRDEERGTVLDKSDEPLFIRHDRVQQKLYPITIKTVWTVVMHAVKGLRTDGYRLPASISPHDFRRYIATYLLSEGMRLEVVQQFLGHASPETTRKAYAMTWDEVLDDQVATYRPALSEAAERARGKVKKFEIRKKAPHGLRPVR
jgi:integrase/recombinase XerD